MNDEAPRKGQTLTATAPTDDTDPPSQKKRNHEDSPAPIPPSPMKLHKATSLETNAENEKCITPTAKIAAEKAFKPFNAIPPINLMSAPGPRLYIKTVANGLFHLIYVQELDGTEAYSHPVLKQLFPNPKERIGKKTDFVRQTGIIAAVPRRRSKALNIPISRRANDNKTFKAMVYVSNADSNALNSKRNVLNAVADVSTEDKTKNPVLEDILSHNYITHNTIHHLLTPTCPAPQQKRRHQQNLSSRLRF
jgi:hypothetical protein